MSKWRRWLRCRSRASEVQLWPQETCAGRSSIRHVLFLRQVPMFEDMSLDQLRLLTAHLDVVHFRRGHVIFAEGNCSQHLYIIVSGRVQIVKASGRSQTRILTTLSAPDFFGDMGIFENVPHGATVVADEATEVLRLESDIFNYFIRHHPTMRFAIGRALSARVRRTTRAHVQGSVRDRAEEEP